MTDSHPITPPPELVKQLAAETHTWLDGITAAYRAGADAELEACCEWLQDPDLNVDTYKLRAARRPKSPSLAEEAMKALQDQIDTSFKISPEAQERANTIRAALIRLQELEQLND